GVRGGELRTRLGDVHAQVVRAMPVTGADRGEKLLHLARVGEQLPVHIPRIPVEQHATQVERDGLDLLLLAGHAATVPAVIAADRRRAVQSWLCRRYTPPGGN